MKTSADLYKYRGETNNNIIKQDITIGKMAELGVTKVSKMLKT